MKKQYTLRSALAAAAVSMSLAGASLPLTLSSASAALVTNISVWGSGGDSSQEQNAIIYAVKAYNKLYAGKYHANLTFVPNISTVQENSPASNEGNVMETDGPTLPFLAWTGKLAPISSYVSKTAVDQQVGVVKAQDTYNGKLYAMAVINSTLAIYGNKHLLNAAGITACPANTPATTSCYPTQWADAWTGAQFTQVLAKLKATPSASNDGGYVWSANAAYGGEYWPYAFLPLLNSAGSPIIQNNSANVLKSDSVYGALSTIASWVPYMYPTAGSATTGGNGGAFANGDLPLAYGGHWQYPGYKTGAVSTTYGADNLVAIPLPNMGKGAKDGAGSNTWTIGASASTKQKAAAGAFLNYISTAAFTKLMTYGNGQTVTSGGVTSDVYGDGAVPANSGGIATNPTYAKGGILYQMGLASENACMGGVITSTCVATPRPVTPGYPAISQAFQTLFSSLFQASATTPVDTNTIKGLVATAVDSINSNFQTYNNFK